MLFPTYPNPKLTCPAPTSHRTINIMQFYQCLVFGSMHQRAQRGSQPCQSCLPFLIILLVALSFNKKCIRNTLIKSRFLFYCSHRVKHRLVLVSSRSDNLNVNKLKYNQNCYWCCVILQVQSVFVKTQTYRCSLPQCSCRPSSKTT